MHCLHGFLGLYYVAKKASVLASAMKKDYTAVFHI